MTKAESNYMSKVASLPCVVCGNQPVELHHVREGQGMSQRAQNWLVIPLCPSCHRDSMMGLHGQRNMWRIKKMDEMDALAKTIELMNI
jgi:hypothetical protein